MHASFNGHGTSSEIRETITLTQEQWSEVRVALRLAADHTRDPQRKATRLALYETLITAGSAQATDRTMGARFPKCAVCVHRTATGLVDGQPRCEEHRPAPDGPAGWDQYHRGTLALQEQQRARSEAAPQGWSHAQGETDAPRRYSVLSDMGDNDSRREG